MNKTKLEEEETAPTKRVKQVDSGEADKDLQRFLDWCEAMSVFIDYDKVKITRSSTSHNYGMVAVKDLKANETLARIPKSSILEPNTSGIKDLIKKSSKQLESESHWSKLILSIMHEKSRSESKFRAYLDLFPNYDLFDLPMFWPEESLNGLLANTPVPNSVARDLENMKKEFDEIILPFVQKNKAFFDDDCEKFDNYKKIVGFIMAYSFRDPDEDPDDAKSVGPMMVPVGDILNHIAKNNAQLRFTKDELLIVSTKTIKQDEEVYNTYGEHTNHDLLHMYGFVEVYPENTYDAVEIPSSIFIETLNNNPGNNRPDLLEKKIEVFKEIGLMDEDTSFVVGADGVLNEEECLHMLQIYSMAFDEFNEFCENDFELLEDEEWDNYSLTKDKIKKLPLDWGKLLKECAQLHKSNLENNLKAIELKFSENAELDSVVKQRVKDSKTLVEGNLALLNAFVGFL